jgi:hypothetical protein
MLLSDMNINNYEWVSLQVMFNVSKFEPFLLVENYHYL